MTQVTKVFNQAGAAAKGQIATSSAYADLDTVQTFTNKTLTAPAISAPVFSGVATGTYELAGTPTITGATLATATLTTPTHTLSVQVLAAAGADQSGAGAITAVSGGLVHATGADGTKGVRLPTAAAGKYYYIKNQDSANGILKVYPASSDAINAIAADSPISMAAKTAAIFVAIDATTWFTFSLLPS